jgi:1,4-dihydroxy-2-naphthoate octaprenyltransferase
VGMWMGLFFLLKRKGKGKGGSGIIKIKYLTKKQKNDRNLITVLSVLFIYTISLIVGMGLLMSLPFISLSLIICGFNNLLYKGQPKYIGYIILSMGMGLLLVSIIL